MVPGLKIKHKVFVLELDGGLAGAPPIDDKLQHSLSRILRGAMTNLKKMKIIQI